MDLSKACFLLACFLWSSLSQAQQLEGAFRTNGKETRQAFRVPQEAIQKSSGVLYEGRRHYGFASLIDQRGYFFAKLSEYQKRETTYLVHKTTIYKELEEVAEIPEWDLILLKVNGQDLPQVTWSSENTEMGKWVVSNGATSKRRRRIRVGIISAKTRPVYMKGEVVLPFSWNEDKEKESVFVADNLDEKLDVIHSDLKEGDQLLRVGEVIIKDTESLEEALLTKVSGDSMTLGMKRGAREFEIEVLLKPRKEVYPRSGTRNDAMSGRISERRSGFPLVLQHSIPMTNRSVGGPLCDLDGKCVGMNISAFSRSESYAIPAEKLLEIFNDILKEPKKDE